MAINKQALIRYKVLDKCFRNQYKRFFIEDLIEACSIVLSDHYGEGKSISRRQIYEDINFMKSEAGYRAPIQSIRQGRRTYYRYENPDFSIESIPLTETELDALQDLSQILGRVKGISGFEWLNEFQTKLDSSTSQTEEHIISFEENEYLHGLEFLQDLYHYIKNQSTLSISYQSFKKDTEETYTIHPYYLKQFNNRWFLFGLNEEFGLQNLALDRIKAIELSELKYIPNESYDFVEYFEDIVGVTNYQEVAVEKIVLEFSAHRLPYIISKPIHGSQKTKENKVYLELKPNKEFISLLLSFGADLSVLKPESLRLSLIEEIEKMKNNY